MLSAKNRLFYFFLMINFTNYIPIGILGNQKLLLFFFLDLILILVNKHFFALNIHISLGALYLKCGHYKRIGLEHY